MVLRLAMLEHIFKLHLKCQKINVHVKHLHKMMCKKCKKINIKMYFLIATFVFTFYITNIICRNLQKTTQALCK